MVGHQLKDNSVTDSPHISVRNLSVHFVLGRQLFGKPPVVRAVDEVSLEIPKGSFFGLVGESGSGKTTLGRAILKAAPTTSGQILYRDDEVEYDLGSIGKEQLKNYRQRAQLIFQDPYAALSPRMTVRDIIAEPLEVMGITHTRADLAEVDLVRPLEQPYRVRLASLHRLGEPLLVRLVARVLQAHSTFVSLHDPHLR